MNIYGEIMSKKIKSLPYGLSDYERLVEKGCHYIDKTMYFKEIEEAPDYLFFIRPRRFGKSLWLSTMEAYYDIAYKDRFEKLFKGTVVFENPTEERGSYLFLKFNFSLVDPSLDKVEDSFLNHVKGVALSFIRKYSDRLLPETDYYLKSIEGSGSATDILSNLVRLCRDSGQSVYTVIDEYDNFANMILSTDGGSAYRDLSRGEGFFRSFFNALKGGTDGIGAPFKRLFLTGVSSVTMDDVTSGFNIGKNVSMESRFSRMLGFTAEDVKAMIQYYRNEELVFHPADQLLEIMTDWYGNYQFTEDDDIRLFNSDMVLYFLDNYLRRKKLPDDLIDRNVRIDYGKLRHLIVIDKKGRARRTNGNFSKLKEIIETGGTTSKLELGFPFEEIADTKNFKSLLYYFGLLTIDGVERDKLRLKIPNETVRRLYYDYITGAYRETDVFDLDLSLYSDLISDMAYDGDWKPLFEYITARMRESMNLRDLITGEKSIQAFLNVYLGLSDLFIVHAEKELKKEAEAQLKIYNLDSRFRKNIEKTTVIRLVLIFSGHNLEYIGAVG
jgi:hypothetical protein